MSTINKFSTADEAWAAIQEEKIFPLESPRLQSLTEGVNVCVGFQEQCGDEIPDNLDLCPTHQRDEDNHYTRLAQDRDRREAVDAGSQYRHLRADHVEALRSVQRQQASLMQAIDGKVA